MSLQGKRVVVTRAAHQAGELADLLRQRGAVPVLYPCIALVPPQDTTALDYVLRNLAAFDWLILTSANTVDILRLRAARLNIAPRLKVAAVGAATAAALRDALGIEADFIPAVQTAEHLAEALPLRPGERVFLPQSAIARPHLRQILSERGAHVTAITAYKTTVGTGGEDVPYLLETGQIDALTFTSSSTVTHFVQRAGTVSEVPAACIGAATAQTAREAGFGCVIAPDADYTLTGLVAVLERQL